MFLTRTEYDRGVNAFSPEGRLFQVEYAIEDIKPQLSPQIQDILLSTFQFDFELEKKILAEAEKEIQNWSRLGLENLPSKTADEEF